MTITPLFPGVHLLHGTVGGRPLQLPILAGKERVLLLDTGCASDVGNLILPALAELGIARARLSHVINTHCDVDHQGGNAGLKQAIPTLELGCGDVDQGAVESPDEIFRQRYDAYRATHGHAYPAAVADWLRAELGAAQPVDRTYAGGEVLTLERGWEVEVIRLPGHSLGHLGVLDRRHRALFGGDAIQGAVYLGTDGRPALCPTYLHVRPYLATISRIEALPLGTYVGCHWPVLHGPAAIRAFCAESRDFVERTEALLLADVRTAGAAGVTLSGLCRSLGPRLGSWPRSADFELCYAVAGHLADLTARGLLHHHNHTAPHTYTARFTA